METSYKGLIVGAERLTEESEEEKKIFKQQVLKLIVAQKITQTHA